MRKVYIFGLLFLCFCIVFIPHTLAQTCPGFGATASATESRCAATGSITVNAFGGSGSYKYKVTGAVSTNYTTTDSITGLPSGTYSVIVNDIITNCIFTLSNVVVPGTYSDPRFTLFSKDVSCDNGTNGAISLNAETFGRSPFTYSIIAPSPMGVGTSNSTGTFSNLKAGIYTIRLTDSCGGIQTRLVTINNYTWKINSYSFTKISCDTAQGFISVSDSKGNVSNVGGIPGFSYGVIRYPGDTIWSANANFSFYLSGQTGFTVIVKDPCGNVKTAAVQLTFKQSVSNTVSISASNCSSFTASITNIVNFYKPTFCLYDSTGTLISCNNGGNFTNLGFGSYCIKASDSCGDTTITRCFNVNAPVISLGNNVLISNKICNSFTASVTGQTGFTNPLYCLLDSSGSQIACNSTGIFNNVAYGSYCISVKDGCRDTTIQRCFSPSRPRPVVPALIVPAYYTCTNFGLKVTGDSLTNPRFCIVDSAGNIITCNFTGVFDSLNYGQYCVTIHDSCYDTTITRCISVLGPQVTNDVAVTTSNLTCSSFTATVTGAGLLNPTYCVYTSNNVLIGCDTTGIFDNLPYGAYYVKARNGCPDTTFIVNFSETPPPISVAPAVTITNQTCNSFSVNISGQQNLTTPTYCLYDTSNVSISCNSTGVFSNINYGAYCIKITDGCTDTTISRCFNVSPAPITLSVNTKKSCSYGYAKFGITVAGGTAPINIKIYNPDSTLLINNTYNATTVTIDSIPGTQFGQTYKIIATDHCGQVDSTFSNAVQSIFTHSAVAVPKCPSSTWVNGSGSIISTVSSNTGNVFVRIVKMNTTVVSYSPSFISGNVITFINLAPAKYVVRYHINDACGKTFYDTVVISPYAYPDLTRSSAYQCDANGFSIGAVVSDGVGPFTYEIIGSSPSTPSIIAPPQASPIFNIDNGTTYSLVRLRALDACGNATLQDASILPLANNGITATFNCFQLNTTLSVDSINGASYAWYKKTSMSSTDSVYLDSASSIYLPFVLPADTGVYLCKIVVNNGCINRWYYFNLDGTCSHYLPVTVLSFTGKYAGTGVLLNWKIAPNVNLLKFAVQRKNADNSYTTIGYVDVSAASGADKSYYFVDKSPGPGTNFYRIKMLGASNDVSYSKEIQLTPGQIQSGVIVYPNPVNDLINIEFMNADSRSYKIKLINIVNQVMREFSFNSMGSDKFQIRRTNDMGSGVYILKVTDLNTNLEYTQKIIFK